MRPAFSTIPTVYTELALDHDGWHYFICFVAMVIHGLQWFERAMIRLVEALILWPFIQIRRTVHYSDSLMVEYFSATASGLFALWVIYGRENSVAHQLMVQRVPEAVWGTLGAALCVLQFIAASRGTLSQRGICCVFGTGFWLFLSTVLLLRVGFSLAHVFSLPMVLACWLAIFMLIAKGTNGPATPAVTN